MNLFTKAITSKLIKNGIERITTGNDDHKPVVKWFNPVGGGTWLITSLGVYKDGSGEYVPDGTAYGLCDLGMGSAEIGSVSVEEISSVKLMMGLGIERDRYFKANKTLSGYADEARSEGRIIA